MQAYAAQMLHEETMDSGAVEKGEISLSLRCSQ